MAWLPLIEFSELLLLIASCLSYGVLSSHPGAGQCAGYLYVFSDTPSGARLMLVSTMVGASTGCSEWVEGLSLTAVNQPTTDPRCVVVTC